MSRSYRKNPVLTDNGSSKQEKRIANHIVRARLKSGEYDALGWGPTSYRRIAESWNIRDYKFRQDVTEARRDSSWSEYKRVWLSK